MRTNLPFRGASYQYLSFPIASLSYISFILSVAKNWGRGRLACGLCNLYVLYFVRIVYREFLLQ